MDLSLLTKTDWQTIEREHPAAHAAMLSMSLRREMEHLSDISFPTDWQFRRLSELCQLFDRPLPARITPREHPEDVLR